MDDMNKRLEQALQPPDCKRLKNLKGDVWRRVHATRGYNLSEVIVPFGVKASALTLVVMAFFALSQVSFDEREYQADLFDLRYFSYQNMPSVTLAAVNTYELAP